MLVQPYLFFDGRCAEAIQFYQQAIGAQVDMLMRYRDSPEPPPPGTRGDIGDWVMHANLRIGPGQVMMADDCTGHPQFGGFSLSLEVADEAEAQRCFDGLANGGQVIMPLGKTFFSPCFGMVRDRFGVSWMLIVAVPPMAQF
ncbi:MAG TPA: VOC family protein [Macromonas sp.]|nr:VOC family protein [Macromonas sp.]